MIGIIILVLPIVFLLSGVVYCAICVWKASKGIPINKVRKEDSTSLQVKFEHEMRVLKLPVLLFNIVLFLVIVVSGIIYEKRVSDQEVTSATFFDSIIIYIYSLVIYLVCKAEIVSFLYKSDTFSALFSQKSSVVILSIIVWSVIGFGPCRAFISNNMLDGFLSSDSIFHSVCIVMSLILIISAAITCTHKMLKYIKN